MPARGPHIWLTKPTMGPPMGVLPRKTIAWSASTRPRISGAAFTCTIAVDAVRKAMLAQPIAMPNGNVEREARRERQREHRDAERGARHDDVTDRDLLAPRGRQRADQRTDADDREQHRERRVAAVERPLHEQRHHDLEVEGERPDDCHHDERDPQLGLATRVGESGPYLPLAPLGDGRAPELAPGSSSRGRRSPRCTRGRRARTPTSSSPTRSAAPPGRGR